MFSIERPTLVIDNGEGQQSPDGGPEADIGNSIDDVFDLRRHVDAALVNVGQWRREGSGVGSHGEHGPLARGTLGIICYWAWLVHRSEEPDRHSDRALAP